MKKLNYNQLNLDQQQQVDSLIKDMEGEQSNSSPTVRFVARGNGPGPGGEFRLAR